MSKRGISTSNFAAIARQVDLSVEVLEYCREAGLVDYSATNVDLIELRRIRRLQMLGVNLEGIEIILRMRRQILARQSEIKALKDEIETTRTRFERELRNLQRRLAQDI